MIKMSKLFLVIASVAFFFTISFGKALHAESIEWITDFEAAKSKAKAENKQIFMFFTGSDWCVWCKKLDAEILQKEEFQKAAQKRYVFLMLDFPQEKKLSEELTAQNKKLAESFSIAGYPTVILAAADGSEIARLSYEKAGPTVFIKTLDDFDALYKELLQFKADLAKAKGTDRAVLLDKIFETYEKLHNESPDKKGIIQEIVQLDPDNKTGLKTKYECLLAVQEATEAMLHGKIDDALAVAEKILKMPGLSKPQQFEAYLLKTTCLAQKTDYAATAACIEKALEIDPENAIVPQLEQLLGQTKKILEITKSIDGLKEEAKKAEGLARAKTLVKILIAQEEYAEVTQTPMNSKEWDATLKEIVALDPEDSLGMKKQPTVEKLLANAGRYLNSGQPEEAREAFERSLKNPDITKEQKQQAHALQAMSYLLATKGADSIDAPKLEKIIGLFKTALEDAPESPMADQIEQYLKSVETLYKQQTGKGKAAEGADDGGIQIQRKPK